MKPIQATGRFPAHTSQKAACLAEQSKRQSTPARTNRTLNVALLADVSHVSLHEAAFADGLPVCQEFTQDMLSETTLPSIGASTQRTALQTESKRKLNSPGGYDLSCKFDLAASVPAQEMCWGCPKLLKQPRGAKV